MDRRDRLGTSAPPQGVERALVVGCAGHRDHVTQRGQPRPHLVDGCDDLGGDRPKTTLAPQSRRMNSQSAGRWASYSGHERRAEAVGGVRRCRPLGAVARDDRHAIAGLDSERGEPASDLVDERGEVRERCPRPHAVAPVAEPLPGGELVKAGLGHLDERAERLGAHDGSSFAHEIFAQALPVGRCGHAFDQCSARAGDGRLAPEHGDCTGDKSTRTAQDLARSGPCHATPARAPCPTVDALRARPPRRRARVSRRAGEGSRAAVAAGRAPGDVLQHELRHRGRSSGRRGDRGRRSGCRVPAGDQQAVGGGADPRAAREVRVPEVHVAVGLAGRRDGAAVPISDRSSRGAAAGRRAVLRLADRPRHQPRTDPGAERPPAPADERGRELGRRLLLDADGSAARDRGAREVAVSVAAHVDRRGLQRGDRRARGAGARAARVRRCDRDPARQRADVGGGRCAGSRCGSSSIT